MILRTSLLMLFSLPVLADVPAINGLWKTISDETGEAEAIIEIEVREDGVYGHIEEILSEPDEETPVCTACTDDRKDHPIVGLEIIRGLQWDGSAYRDGRILDPNSGTEYRCVMVLDSDGESLEVRGYIGIPLLGRSQTWYRVDS